ncbi:MAG: metal-sensing transcriptional repressor [Raoultibacter sp.]|jgi:DNA-binding FrmR family transcriptional regulator
MPEDLQHSCCDQHTKNTPRSIEMQQDIQRRLNRAIGQLNGVKTMIDDNRYCGDVLTQLTAAESAIRSVSSIVLQNHLETCVVEQIQEGNTEIIGEVMRLMKKFS